MLRQKKPAISTSTNSEQLRLRIFAGPNGSGKSTVIKYVRKVQVNGRPIDFGYYINADDIAQQLRTDVFSFHPFHTKVANKNFRAIALDSGLVNNDFNASQFKNCYSLRLNKIKLRTKGSEERLAQIIADFLRKRLLAEKKKFSFETVFSHRSKLEVMQEAVALGYKVYLYFVSTESPRINKFRVKARTIQGGHDVPPGKIRSRYYRSLNYLYDACQMAYQVFFFDNSVDGQESVLFAHFKVEKRKKKWDLVNRKNVPYWFRKYYSNKIPKRK